MRRVQTEKAARSSPPPPPQDSGPGLARPDAGPRGTAAPEGCSGKARPQSWTRSCLHSTHPPTGGHGVTPLALHSTDSKQNAAAPHRVPPVPRPPAAVPVPDGPARAGQGENWLARGGGGVTGAPRRRGGGSSNGAPVTGTVVKSQIFPPFLPFFH